jgi:hypothetical protein
MVKKCETLAEGTDMAEAHRIDEMTEATGSRGRGDGVPGWRRWEPDGGAWSTQASGGDLD